MPRPSHSRFYHPAQYWVRSREHAAAQSFLHFPVTSSLLGPNILLNILFSNIIIIIVIQRRCKPRETLIESHFCPCVHRYKYGRSYRIARAEAGPGVPINIEDLRIRRSKLVFVRVHNTTEYWGEFESIRANTKQKVLKKVLFGNQLYLCGDVPVGDSMGSESRSSKESSTRSLFRGSFSGKLVYCE
jgi:hypothetical protein